MKIKTQGKFRYEVYSPDGQVVEESAFIPNLITDKGLEYFSTPSNKTLTIAFGTGSRDPANSDATLESIVPSSQYNSAKNVSSHYQPVYNYAGSGDYSVTQTLAYDFTQFTTGQNITEVGVGYFDGSNFTTVTRALVKDNFGAKTVVSVPQGYSLRIIYQITQTFATSPAEYSIEEETDSGVTSEKVMMRLANVGTNQYGAKNFQPFHINGAWFHEGEHSDITKEPTGQYHAFGTDSVQLVSYSASEGAKYKMTLGTGMGNPSFSNYKSILFRTTRGNWVWSYDTPKVSKTKNEEMELEFTIKVERG